MRAMRRLRNSWKYNVLIRWIVTGSVVLIIPVACALLVFGMNKNLLEKKMEQINTFILQGIHQNIDERMAEIINIAGYAQEEYKDVLAWLNKLYTEKLLDPNFSTVDQNTVNSNILTGVSGVSAGLVGSRLGVLLTTNLASHWAGNHGLQHFLSFFRSVYFGRLIKNTLIISISSLVVTFPLPIVLALLINEVRGRIFKGVVQTLSYLPHFISLVVICSMVTLFVNERGFITNLLVSLVIAEEGLFNSVINLFLVVTANKITNKLSGMGLW